MRCGIPRVFVRGAAGPGWRRPVRAFTLIELLVVVAIIALLAALLLPALGRAKGSGQRAVCLSNLKEIGLAIHLYADENGGRIPYGPVAPPFSHPAEFYPSTGSPTSLLSLRQGGAPVGLGLLLKYELARTPKVLFCPGTDQPVNAEAELDNVGKTQAQGSFYYRHGGVTKLFYTPPAAPDGTRLDNPGQNRNGVPIRALALDSQFLTSLDGAYNVRPRTHHRRQTVNILYRDGSARSANNRDGRYTLDLRDNAALYDAFNRILGALETADAEY